MKPIIIANWKMNLNFRESVTLAEDLFKNLSGDHLYKKDVVICPSISSFLLVAEIFKQHNFIMGVQDVFWEDKGAFTGCESPKFLFEAGCRVAIIGHSERRENLKETDEMIHRKVKSSLSCGLAPVLCVGETYDQRISGKADNAIMSQIVKALSGIDLLPKEQLIIAYEPVWVIGSGRAIEPGEAQHAFRLIHQTLLDLFPLTIIQNNIRIVYGGSVDGKNAKDFVNLDHFMGFLVGGSSLRAEEFTAIVKQVN